MSSSKFWTQDSGSESSDDKEPSTDCSTPRRQKKTRHSHPSQDPNACWEEIQNQQVFLDPPISTKRTAADDSGKSTRIVCMSDTHGKHGSIAVPEGDVLIHAGDLTRTGETKQIQSLRLYFDELLKRGTIRKQVICIAGNHDLTFHKDYYDSNWERFHRNKRLDENATKSIFVNEQDNARDDFHYLEDSSCRLQESGLLVYGSPWSPEFFNWAFNKDRGKECKEVWSDIPMDTDVLVTHGPPLGRGDLCSSGSHAGCYDLLEQIQEHISPRLHIFGHIHEAYGVTYDGKTLYVNASSVDLRYQPVHPCIVIDLPHEKSQPARVVQPKTPAIASGRELVNWFKRNADTYAVLAGYFASVDDKLVEDFPFGNFLLDSVQAFLKICDMLLLHRDLDARQELQKALSRIYADSF